MKIIIIMLVVLLGLLQYELWFADGGIVSVYRLHQNINEQQLLNEKLMARNAVMKANIKDLKEGSDAIEEHARYDLGMVKKNETFYQIIPNPHG